MQSVELSSYCSARGLVQGLDLRKSDWDRSGQQQYAAVDAAASLGVFEVAQRYPDLTVPCSAGTAKVGDLIDVVCTGANWGMCASIAEGEVVATKEDSATWTNPLNDHKVQLTALRRVVKIDCVHAPAFQLKSFLSQRVELCQFALADFGDTPFEVVLDFYNMAPHSAHRRPFSTQAAAQGCSSALGSAASGSGLSLSEEMPPLDVSDDEGEDFDLTSDDADRLDLDASDEDIVEQVAA